MKRRYTILSVTMAILMAGLLVTTPAFAKSSTLSAHLSENQEVMVLKDEINHPWNK